MDFDDRRYEAKLIGEKSVNLLFDLRNSISNRVDDQEEINRLAYRFDWFITLHFSPPIDQTSWMDSHLLDRNDNTSPRLGLSSWTTETTAGRKYLEFEQKLLSFLIPNETVENFLKRPSAGSSNRTERTTAVLSATIRRAVQLDNDSLATISELISLLAELRKHLKTTPYLSLVYENGELWRIGFDSEIDLTKKPKQKRLFDVCFAAKGNPIVTDDMEAMIYDGQTGSASKLSTLKSDLNKTISDLRVEVDSNYRLVDIAPENSSG